MAYQCKDCPYKTDDKSNFLRHYKRRSGTCLYDPSSGQDILFPCRNPGCESQFSLLKNRVRHEKSCKLGLHTTDTNRSESNATNSDNSVSGHHNTQNNTNNIDNSTDNSTHNNVNVTVNIQNFDTFTPEGIGMQKFVQYMSDGATNVILKCLEEQQFNLDHPDKMNVFVSNLKDRIARVYDGCRWTARNGDDIVEKVFELYTDVIQESVDEFADDDKISTAVKRRIAAWNRNNGTENFEEFAKNKIMYHLYNLRDIVKDMHGVRQRG